MVEAKETLDGNFFFRGGKKNYGALCSRDVAFYGGSFNNFILSCQPKSLKVLMLFAHSTVIIGACFSQVENECVDVMTIIFGENWNPRSLFMEGK